MSNNNVNVVVGIKGIGGLLMDNIQKKIKAQEGYCKDNKVPFFAPKTGKCFKCHKQIFEKITLEEASNELITGCPFCNYSYVD